MIMEKKNPAKISFDPAQLFFSENPIVIINFFYRGHGGQELSKLKIFQSLKVLTNLFYY